jgi:hypothetical protein
VVLDGKPVGISSPDGLLAIDNVPMSNHMLSVKHDGYEDFSQSFSIDITEFGRSFQISLREKRKLATPPADFREPFSSPEGRRSAASQTRVTRP